MNPAVLFGLGTMITWGFWIVFGDVASSSIDPGTAAAISYVAVAVVTVAYALVSDASLAATGRGLAFSLVAGVAAAIGVLVLGEPISLTKVAGIGLAVVAIVLINR
ncbi:EamA family transporter [Salinigranum salinum]|uniref:EamA family transporter n=1 Tax=Salinigranum salinum TaxID=1364937 RepID=UPI001260EA81|nr:EamA family transporter [Salinigranum salinum]